MATIGGVSPILIQALAIRIIFSILFDHGNGSIVHCSDTNGIA